MMYGVDWLRNAPPRAMYSHTASSRTTNRLTSPLVVLL